MSRAIVGACVVAILSFSAGRAGPVARAGGWSDRVAVPRPAEKEIDRWPARSRSAARVTMARYGMPDEVGEDALVWRNNGPWKKTTVHRRAWLRYLFGAEPDCVENAVAYDVPTRSLGDLELFDDRITADPAGAELSSRAESEAGNYLTLNLADEIINGKRTVAEAKVFQARILRLADSGKSSPYLAGLLFAPGRGALSRASLFP
ncbi:MAG: hypothetical protein HYV14_15090 [Elusimicrobia bacterium]|nr:hypothetical protein [Elusimicrobiota bacterium]